MPRSITLQQIASHLGLSKATVSVALRGRPGVSADVRQRIVRAADRLGYRQNPLIGIHMAHVRNSRGPRYQATLAWIDNFPTRTGLKSIPIFREYFEGARDQAANLGFKLEEFWLPSPDMTPAKLNRVLRTRNITGLLLAPQPHSGSRLDLAWEQFAAVSLGYSLISPRVHLVTNHHYRTFEDCMARLRGFGYRHIGVIINLENDRRVNRARTTVFWGDYHEHPSVRHIPPLFFHEVENPLTPEMVADWMEKHHPDAIIAEDYIDRLHAGLDRVGLKAGKDIAVALRGPSIDDPFHAGMHQNERMIGSAATDFLVGMLHRNERGIPAVPQHLLVESTWKSGPSVDESGPRRK